MEKKISRCKKKIKKHFDVFFHDMANNLEKGKK